MSELELSMIEVSRITGYTRPTKQLEVLKSLGVPALRRPDNTVLVLRMHCIHPTAITAVSNAPKLKALKR